MHTHKPVPFGEQFRAEILLDYELTPESKVSLTMKCRINFLKSEGLIKSTVESFFENGTVKHS
jgi:hypothetical protein